MSEEQWITLLLKVFLVSGFSSLVAWIGIYSWLAPWWRDPIGRTLVSKSALIAGLFVPGILSLFFHLGARGSLIAGWVDVGLVGLVTPVMIWRCVVWLRESPHRHHGIPGRRLRRGEKR